MTVALDDSTPSKKIFTPWQSALITVVLLFCIGFFAIKMVKSESVQPIVIDGANLTMAEFDALSNALQPLGEVQFFSVDLRHVHEAVSSLSWVESAEVSRDWYRGILVSVVPRKAIANFGSQQMLDANGVVFVPADKNMLMNHHLVTLHGEPQRVKTIMAQMQRVNLWFEPLELTAQDVILTPRQTWVIRFQNGFRVIVDHENTEQKLYSAAKILDEQFKDKIPTMQSVDLRYKNGFSIAWKDIAP